MFLAAYHFSGDPTALLAAYDALDSTGSYHPDFHACVRTDSGISIYDSCPSREVFEGFSTNPEFLADLARVGLPAPRIEPLGDIHRMVPALT